MATGLLLDVVVHDDLDARLDALAQLGTLDTVSEPQREAMLLRALGFEYRIVALMLGVPLGTSSSRVRLGRERLRRNVRSRRRS
jgi:DNA-directed RNA polymerase specialized sigma24 family protein